MEGLQAPTLYLNFNRPEIEKKACTWHNSTLEQIKCSSNPGSWLTPTLYKIKTKKPSKRARDGKNAEKATLEEDFQATTGYLNFNPPQINKKNTWHVG